MDPDGVRKTDLRLAWMDIAPGEGRRGLACLPRTDVRQGGEDQFRITSYRSHLVSLATYPMALQLAWLRWDRFRSPDLSPQVSSTVVWSVTVEGAGA